MQRIRNALLACISLLLCSCAKTPFSNGLPALRTDAVSERFRVVMANDNVDIQLQHATANHPAGTYVVKAGESIIDKILVEHPTYKNDTGTLVSYDTVIIRNENRLNWLRPYDTEISVTLYYDAIREIVFNSNGNLRSDVLCGVPEPVVLTIVGHDSIPHLVDTLLNHLYVNVAGGSGDLDLKVQCDRLSTDYVFGTARVKLEGKCPITFTYTSYNSHGPVDALNLWTNFHYIYHYGTNIVYAFAKHQIDINIFNNGILKYKKDPSGTYPEVPLDDTQPNIVPIWE